MHKHKQLLRRRRRQRKRRLGTRHHKQYGRQQLQPRSSIDKSRTTRATRKRRLSVGTSIHAANSSFQFGEDIRELMDAKDLLQVLEDPFEDASAPQELVVLEPLPHHVLGLLLTQLRPLLDRGLLARDAVEGTALVGRGPVDRDGAGNLPEKVAGVHGPPLLFSLDEEIAIHADRPPMRQQPAGLLVLRWVDLHPMAAGKAHKFPASGVDEGTRSPRAGVYVLVLGAHALDELALLVAHLPPNR